MSKNGVERWVICMRQPSKEMAGMEFSHTEEGDLVLIFRGIEFDRQLRSAFRELGTNAHDYARKFRQPVEDTNTSE